MKTYSLHNPFAEHEDIGKLQRALQADGYYTGAIDNQFGPGTAEACRSAKYALGYPTKEISPIGGQKLLNFLTGKTALPASYNKTAKSRQGALSKSSKQRDSIVAFCRWSISNEPQIHYAQVRPMDHLQPTLYKKLPWWADCSEHTTTAYKQAGAPDPNGRNFSGIGYTGDMLAHGTTIPLSQAKRGDVVIYWPPSTGHHVAILMEDGTANGGNPMLCSHGSEGGPRDIRFADELRAQAGLGAGHYTIKKYIKD